MSGYVLRLYSRLKSGGARPSVAERLLEYERDTLSYRRSSGIVRRNKIYNAFQVFLQHNYILAIGYIVHYGISKRKKLTVWIYLLF